MRLARTRQHGERFVEVVQQQAMPVIRAVVRKDRQGERIALILVQIAGLVVSRYLFAYPPVVATQRHQLIQSLGSAVQGYLSGPLPDEC